jgi:hypothetical protein
MRYIYTLTFLQLMLYIYSSKTSEVSFDFTNRDIRIVNFKLNDTCYSATYSDGGELQELIFYRDSL